MEASILTSTKKILNVAADDTSFDVDIVTHINTALTVLTQIGLGPVGGFMIEDDEATWDEFIGDDIELNSVKTYVFLKVRMLFDPPQTSYLINAMKDQIEEFEARLKEHRELNQWTNPNPEDVDPDELLEVDGGGAI